MDIRIEFGWKPAIAEWRRGNPGRLVELLRNGKPIPVELLGVVADLIEQPRKRGGRPSRLKGRDHLVRHRFYLLTVNAERPRRLSRKDALKSLAQRYHTTTANIEDALAMRGAFRWRPPLTGKSPP